MASAVTTMPSSVSSGSTEHRRSDSEAGPHGFTAVNITPPQSRESSATSPDVSPRHGTTSAGRQNMYMNGHDQSQEHKRKRSISSEQGLRSPRRYDYNPPKRVDSQQHLADSALHVLDTTNQASSHSNYYSTVPNGQGRSGYAYERPYGGSNGMHNSTPEGRSSEAFQRDNDDQHYSNPVNADDQQQPDDQNNDGSSVVMVQHEVKRKRNFTNRTKTGCITCRNRKKKCDEGRPHCNNCIRGGFECAGYNLTRPGNWPKHSPTPKQPLLLQSKMEDELSPYREGETPVSANPKTSDAAQMRPNMAGDGHEQSRPVYVSNTSTPADPRPPYPGQPQHQPQPQWTQPQHTQQPQHDPSQQQYAPEHLPPLNELTRPEQQPSHQQPPPRHDYPPAPQHEMSRPPTQAASTGPPPAHTPQQWQQQPQQPPPQQQHQPQTQQQHQAPPQQEYGNRSNTYPPRINTTQPTYTPSNRLNTGTANTASASYTTTWDQKAGSKVFLEEDVERSKMIRGANYSYFDPTLKNERQRCANALFRYNNACQLGSGVSEEAAQSMLAKVFNPLLDKTHAFIVAPRQEGLLGPGVVIEPGFRCTYGYNIRIYDNAFIGENTRIDDSGRVEIGARTWIGANVTILTNDVAKDAIQRKGTDGQQCHTRNVVIGPQVIIGTGAVIYPGVQIGAHATIEPFAVVKNNVPEHVLQKAPMGAQSGSAGSHHYGHEGGMLGPL